MVKAYDVSLAEVLECGDGIATFRFSRPEEFGFRAGQYATVELTTREGVQRKPFTICSAPHDPYLEVTTRMSRSPYKAALWELAPQDAVRLAGPYGKLVLGPSMSRLAFLVGGVGITPARSMLRDLVHRRVDFDAVVFFGNRSISCIPFLEELEQMGDRGVECVHVLEEPPEDWPGPAGFITADVVRNHLGAERAEQREWIVAGPPVMVEVMVRILDEIGVPEDGRMVERFEPGRH